MKVGLTTRCIVMFTSPIKSTLGITGLSPQRHIDGGLHLDGLLIAPERSSSALGCPPIAVAVQTVRQFGSFGAGAGYLRGAALGTRDRWIVCR